MPRGSAPGERRGGRQKGTPNKITTQCKAVLTAAFEQIGGLEAFVAWGKNNQTAFYQLWGKMIPAEIKNADGEDAFRMVITEYVVHAEDSEEDRTTPDTSEVPSE